MAAASTPAPRPTSATGPSPLAIASVVLGLLSLPSVFCCACIGFPLPLVGFALGAFAWLDARNKGHHTTLAIAGTALNLLILIGIAAIITWSVLIDKQDFDSLMTPPEIIGRDGSTDAGTNDHDLGNGPDSSPDVDDGPQTSWPDHPDATWPPGCLIEEVGPHPHDPLFAIACTHSEGETGAVVVFDARDGRIRTTTDFANYVGWEGGHLMFNREGTQLATNVGTNGIALIDQNAQIVGLAYPDETRDHGVVYAWVDHRIYTDTRALFAIEKDDRRFDFETLDAPYLVRPILNPDVGAVVGTVRTPRVVERSDGATTVAYDTELAGYDPIQQEVVYQTPLPPGRVHIRWAPDGRYAVAFEMYREEDQYLKIFDGNDGSEIARMPVDSPSLGTLKWSPNGVLAVEKHKYDRERGGAYARKIDLIRGAKVEHTVSIDARVRRMSWSPSGDRLAYISNDQIVRVIDVEAGRIVRTFQAPSPPVPTGLPDWYNKLGREGDLTWVSKDRLARWDGHFVSFWTPEGKKVAEIIVPVKTD